MSVNDIPEDDLPEVASIPAEPKVEKIEEEVDPTFGKSPEEWASVEVKEIDLEDVDITLPAGKQSEIIERRAMLPTDPSDAKDIEEAVYTQTLSLGSQTRMKNDLLYAAVEGENATNWVQAVAHEEGKIGATRPRVKDTDVKVSGSRAVLRMRSLLGIGGQLTIPLWHSGFFATFNAPSEEAILALHNQITSERVALGRHIYGASLANEAVYVNKILLDFAYDHLVDTNLVDGKEGFLRELSALDIQHVAWAMACLMYQNGFNFARAIITEDPTEQQVQTGKINVTKLQRTRRDLLTEKQIRHMAKRNQRVSKEALEVYRNEFTRGIPREVKLTDDISVVLSVPTAIAHIDAGYAWVEGIVSMVDASFNVGHGVEERNRQINTLSKATQMRQFDHWVKEIRIKKPSHLGEGYDCFERDDEFTIEMMLAELSSDDSLRKNFFEGVRNYMNDSTISLIAVPVASDLESEAALPNFKELYPIDAVAVFILLLTRRQQSVVDRSTL